MGRSMRIPDRLAGYLDSLAQLGFFGKTRGDVARHFIERGIEQAVRDDFIEMELQQEDQKPKEENDGKD